MEWNYAELSKEAKRLGGPEALTEFLVESGRKQMIPWCWGIGVLCVGIGIGGTKVVEFVKKKRDLSKYNIELAKEELINGINQFDSEHGDEIKED